jgi:hypothetical protein
MSAARIRISNLPNKLANGANWYGICRDVACYKFICGRDAHDVVGHVVLQREI